MLMLTVSDFRICDIVSHVGTLVSDLQLTNYERHE